MATLDNFLPSVLTQDTRKRQTVHPELVRHLQDPGSSLVCEETDKFIDGLASWVSSSNYKISLYGLEILSLLVNRFGDGFRTHVPSVLQPVADRLGDSKDPVREAAQELLLKLMVPASSPQFVFDRLTTAFTHKLWRVREEILICIQSTLNHYGAKSLTLSKLVPYICKLLDDQSGPVREAAIATLVEVYRHVGERVRTDLGKKDISQAKLNVLFARMDEVRNSGNMVATADAPRMLDETDFARPQTVRMPKTTKRANAPASGTLGRRGNLGSGKGSSSGAFDENDFKRLFEEVPKVNIFSSRDVQDHLTKIKDVLSDPSNDWEKRTETLKEIRSLLIAGAVDHDDFFRCLRLLEPSLVISAKDLRSQVVRETCITIAYLSQQLGNKFDHTAEAVLPCLINLIPNSAKIMASSGIIGIKFVIQHTHAPRLIPIITSNLSSKSSVIRRECIDMIERILNIWPTHSIERHIAILQEAIKKGLSDADSEARAHSRKAFWGFANHFKEQADSLLNSLDASKQKMLQGELSNSSSNNSINSASSMTSRSKGRVRSVSVERSNDLPSRTSSGTARRVAVSRPAGRADRTDGTDNNGLVRSSSAVDLATGMRRPSASRLPQSSYNSLPRQKKPISTSTAQSIISPDRSRPRSKIGVSQSQPGSRSSSPSSRLSYLTHTTPGSSRVRRKSGIPRSQGTSRETSPTRGQGMSQTNYINPFSVTHSGSSRIRHKSGIPRSQGASRETSPSRERKLSGSGLTLRQAHRLPHSKGSTAIAQRVLTQSSEVEQAISDALRGPPRRMRYESYDSDDAASETSSVCSERSFSSFVSRTSEHSDTGERKSRMSKDVSEILSNMASGSWADRKDGLIAFQNLLRSSRLLNRMELKKVTEIFTRMFHDPHGKVFSTFVDTLMDFVYVHKLDIQDWLYILLTRLLNKLGTEMLGSVTMKVQRCLETIRESFAYDQQFNILTRYIIDQTQTPNLKVKVALLNYMHGLTMIMDPGDFANTSDTRLAVSRIITWTSEPKSNDVRKAAQAVLISLFNLNSPEFTMMLTALPKTFQDGAYKILHSHLRGTGMDTEPLTPRNVVTPPGRLSRPSPTTPARDELETENMNPEEIYNSIKKTSADIQNWSKLDSHYDDTKKERDSTSQDSGIQSSMPDVRGGSPDTRSELARRRLHYNPSHYQDEKNGYNRAALEEAVFDVDNELFNEDGTPKTKDIPTDTPDVITDILKELSNHNERTEQRRNAMLQLIKMTREGMLDMWEDNFKTILLLLLETLGDNDGHIRSLSLRVLREILRHQPDRFKEYTELTILKVLEAHKDSQREVVRSAEDCAGTLASSIQPEQCIRVLNPIIQTEEYPVNLAAIKMETKVIEGANKNTLLKLLPDIIPGLLKGYDNSESSVRKASVFSLVALYVVVGEDLRPFLKELTGSKIKLLNLYIKRALAQKEEGGEGSKTSSDVA